MLCCYEKQKLVYTYVSISFHRYSSKNDQKLDLKRVRFNRSEAVTSLPSPETLSQET